MQIPGKEGLSKVERLDQMPDDWHVMQISQATSLGSLVEEYAFFTHALLFTHGKWERDPVLDYVMQQRHCEVHRVMTNMPIFSGLEHRKPNGEVIPDWNHILLACHKDHWNGLRDYMMQVGGFDRLTGYFYRMLVQVIPVIDAVAMDRMVSLPGQRPMIYIMTFGLDGNKGQVYFKPALNPPIDQVTVGRKPASIETTKLAKAVMEGNRQPFSAIEQPGAPLLKKWKGDQSQSIKEILGGREVLSNKPDGSASTREEVIQRNKKYLEEARRVLNSKPRNADEDQRDHAPRTGG